jgi:2-methylisocitrate lyase-like PEP mutase family enzyme
VTGTRELAERFAQLHDAGAPLRLVNVWDVVSAQVAEHAGAQALGTSSFAVALAHGYPDGEAVPWPEVRELVADIVDAVGVPVTVDIEAGRGTAPDAVATTVADVVAAGAVGVNLEDSVPAKPGTLFGIEEQCARIAAARQAADAGSVHRFVNARCDVWFGAEVAPDEKVSSGRRRARAYVDAGADGIFLPGLVDADDLRTMVDAIEVPVNVMLWPGLPAIGELQAVGVRRVSQGGASFLHALVCLEQATTQYLGADALVGSDAGSYVPAPELMARLASWHR